MGSLQKKSALVIGGGSGVGLAAARALAAQGCQVAIAGRRQTALDAALESWHGEPPLIGHPVDVAARDSVTQLFAWVGDQMGAIDILVNSAGVNVPNRTMADMPPDLWDHVLAVNATGTYNAMYAVLPQMRARQDGVIINIISLAGKRAEELGGVAYNASKFAASALSTTVGTEERDHGIRICAIYPGEINTPLLEQRSTPVSDERRAAMLQPDDVGDLVAMVAALPAHVHIPELLVKPIGQRYT